MNTSFIEKELELAIETIRIQFSIAINVLTVMVLANITLIGYSFNSQSAGILLLGSILPFIMYKVILSAKKYMVPVAFTAIYLEKEYGEKKDSYIALTFINFILGQKVLNELNEIAALKTHEERMQLLKKINRKYHWTPFGIVSKLIITITLVQLLSPLLFILFLNWKWF